jgi:lipopolysaccharide transport system ATP-binding protein
MKKREIDSRFDEIVEFSGVEKFIDTPVKRYSSGMRVRLAFSVAAHLEPEILIIDEVLAVGDAEFQKKCLGKMQDVAEQGRTVLFVSHNMAAVGRLCSRSILLDNGRIRLNGSTDEVLSQYLKTGNQTEGVHTWDETLANNLEPRFRMRALRVLAEDGSVTSHVDIRRPFTIEIEFIILETLPQFRLALRFITSDGIVAFTTSDSASPAYESKLNTPGVYSARCSIPGNLLNEGSYSLTLSADIALQKTLLFEEGVVGFLVEQMGGVNSRFSEKWPGVVCPFLEWHTEPIPNAVSPLLGEPSNVKPSQ